MSSHWANEGWTLIHMTLERNPMNRSYITIMALVAILSFCGGKAFCQKETYVVIEHHIPDSTRVFIVDKIDTAKVLQGWSSLKRGMQAKEVESLLGRPNKIAQQPSDNSTTWYYNEYEVVFDIIKHTVRYWSK